MNGTRSTFSDSDWPRVARYLAGDLEGVERAEMEVWIAASPERSQAIEKLFSEWKSVPERSWEGWDVETGVKRVTAGARLRNVGASETSVRGTTYASYSTYASVSDNSQPFVRRIAGRVFPSLATGNDVSRGVYSQGTLPRWVGYGLGAVVLTFGFVSWQVIQSRANNPTSAPEAYTIYTTKPGQRASLRLGDGSRVTLGPLTALRVFKGKSPNSRVTVEVNGEALFNIEHTAKVPFTVTAHGVTTRVLGTEFVIRAYDASLVRVAVRDGRVSVQSPVFTSANAAIVNAGEAVSATPNALPVVTPITDIDTDFSWANGELVLKNIPLGEAFVRLSRWYGIEFRVTDPALLEAKIDMVFPSSFRQGRVDVLSAIIKAKAKRTGNIITFSPTP